MGERPNGHAKQVVEVVCAGRGLRVVVLIFVVLNNCLKLSLLLCISDLGESPVLSLVKLGDQCRLLLLGHNEITFNDRLDESGLVGESRALPLHLSLHVSVTLLVVLQTNAVELFENVKRRCVLVDTTLVIECDQVSRCHGAGQLEGLLNRLFIATDRLHLTLLELDNEVHLGRSVVLGVVLDEGRSLLGLDDVLKPVLEGLGPEADRKFGDFNLALSRLGDLAAELVALTSDVFDFAGPSAEPWLHGSHGFLASAGRHASLEVFDDLDRVVVGNGCAPTSADTVCSVDENHGNDRHVHLGLDLLAIVRVVLEESLVGLVKDTTGEGRESSINITRAGCILSTL